MKHSESVKVCFLKQWRGFLLFFIVHQLEKIVLEKIAAANKEQSHFFFSFLKSLSFALFPLKRNPRVFKQRLVVSSVDVDTKLSL